MSLKSIKEEIQRQFTVREYRETDRKRVIELYISVFSSPPWNDDLTFKQILQFIERLEAMNTFWGFVLVDHEEECVIGASLGFIRPWFGGEQYHLDALYIDVAYQNRKLGSYFLQIIKQALKSSGIPAIFLDTEKGTDAEFFYQRNGFTALTESVNYACSLVDEKEK